jgi:phosphoribosylformylglycinamidine cyclo-ligase
MTPDDTLPASSYKAAGVDIDAKMTAIERIKARAQSTFGAQAGPIGHFGGTFLLHSGPDQIMVASADGVGTKVSIALAAGGDAHAGIGRDIVHHCANDILALGARPLFFLDYFGCGKLDPEIMTTAVGGASDACRDLGMALIGGETAEMPGTYREQEYDLVGFIVGAVAPDRVVDGSSIRPGDVVIGYPSAGLHTNGYTLARAIMRLTGQPDADAEALGHKLVSRVTFGDALLAEHRSYEHAIRPLLDAGVVRGMAHITGGGLKDNLPRTLPVDCIARLDPASWDVPPIFSYLVEQGRVSVDERYRVFNMGIGFVIVVRPDDAAGVLSANPEARRIGAIVDRVTSDEAAVQGLFC